MEIDWYPSPNPALTAILNGNQLRAYCLQRAQHAKRLYQAIVDRGDESRPGDIELYSAANAYTEKTHTRYGSRWSGVMEVTSDHILPHDFGWETERDNFVRAEADLNAVLEML